MASLMHSSSCPFLLLPLDVLRLLLLGGSTPSSLYLDNCSRFQCRQVCRSFRSLLLRMPIPPVSGSPIELAAKQGFIPLLQFQLGTLTSSRTLERSPRSDTALRNRCLAAAACGGQLAVLEWLFGYFVEDPNRSLRCVCVEAAAGGHLEVLKFLQIREHFHPTDPSKCIPMPEIVWLEAAARGHLHILSWGYSQRHMTKLSWPLRAAARKGHLDILQWYVTTCDQQVGISFFIPQWRDAAAEGHLHILKWAFEQGYTDSVVSWIWAAASGGHISVLEWLSNIPNVPLRDESRQLCLAAASGGHLQVLLWAKAKGILHMDGSVAMEAAKGSHLQLLQWLKNNGCPWDAEGIRRSARCAAVTSWLETSGAASTEQAPGPQ